MKSKLFYVCYLILTFFSCQAIYFSEHIFINIFRIYAGIVLLIYLSNYSQIIPTPILVNLALSVLIILIPFFYTKVFVFYPENPLVFFSLTKNFCHLYILKFEKNDLLSNSHSLKYVFVIIILTILFFQLINSLTLSDSLFYSYLSIGIIRILSIWFFFNRQVFSKSYYYGLASVFLFCFCELAWAINIVLDESLIQIFLVITALFYFLAEYYLFECFIHKYSEEITD